MFVPAFRKSIFTLSIAFIVLFGPLLLFAQSSATPSSFQNPQLRQRVDNLLKKMTLDEKIGNWIEETEQFDVWVGNSSKVTEHATFRVIP